MSEAGGDGQMIHCLAYEGLCNRVNCVASAMATGRPVSLSWAVNSHCPVAFEDIFSAICGIEVVNERIDRYSRSTSAERLCWFYPKNVLNLPAASFRARLIGSYRRLLAAMKTAPFVVPPSRSLALVYRHHLAEIDHPVAYLAQVERMCRRLNPTSVHVASDSHEQKQCLIDHLQRLGYQTSSNDCALLTHDLDRTCESVAGMCMDLKSLAGCNLGALANNTRSTVSDSLRAFGVQAYYTFDDGFHRHGGRDDLFEHKPVGSIFGAGTE
jgi:hypothetical protein